MAHEENPERRGYYECCWHLGGAQTDVADLNAEDIDWEHRIVSFRRRKTSSICLVRIGPELERVLQSLPRFGPLFPEHRQLTEGHRAKEFWRACHRVKVSGITLPPTATPGPNGRRSAGIRNALPKRRWGTKARPCIARMPAGRRSRCRPWRTTRTRPPFRNRNQPRREASAGIIPVEGGADERPEPAPRPIGSHQEPAAGLSRSLALDARLSAVALAQWPSAARSSNDAG